LALYRDAGEHDRLALFGDVMVIDGDLNTMSVKMADTQLLLGSGAAETRTGARGPGTSDPGEKVHL